MTHLKYIQFIGTQRSGSNLLRVMLNQLPEVSAPHPPHILKTFYPLLNRYGNLNVDENFHALVHDVCEWVNVNPVPWEDFVAVPEKLIGMCERRDLLEIFSNIYEQKAIHDNATSWCCKSMESVFYTDQIEAYGLHPYYIHIFRDGRDVALSFLKAIVGPKHIYFLAKKWKEEQELSLLVKKKVDPKRFIEVRYEELIHTPAAVMQSICDKLGIAYTQEVFEYFHSHESLNTASSGKMWSNLSKPILQENHDKFLRELTDNQIRIFERVAGDLLHTFGYKPLHWPALPLNNFTKDEIAGFQREAEQTAKKVLASADENEISRRQPQEKLLARITSKKILI